MLVGNINTPVLEKHTKVHDTHSPCASASPASIIITLNYVGWRYRANISISYETSLLIFDNLSNRLKRTMFFTETCWLTKTEETEVTHQHIGRFALMIIQVIQMHAHSDHRLQPTALAIPNNLFQSLPFQCVKNIQSPFERLPHRI